MIDQRKRKGGRDKEREKTGTENPPSGQGPLRWRLSLCLILSSRCKFLVPFSSSVFFSVSHSGILSEAFSIPIFVQVIRAIFVLVLFGILPFVICTGHLTVSRSLPRLVSYPGFCNGNAVTHAALFFVIDAPFQDESDAELAYVAVVRTARR